MLKLFRWLVGYVRFSFSGGFCENFLSECLEKELNIRNVVFRDGAVTGECPARLFDYLKPIAKKHGGTLECTGRTGLGFFLERFKGRWGLFTGAAVGVCLVCLVSGFVWSIEITGNSALSETQIRSFLEQNGFHEGVYLKNVDKDKLENLLLASFEECAWAHINTEGTCAVVEIGESRLKPDVVNRNEYTNLKAKKDGIIVIAHVHDGWAYARRGDAVAKGDMLISGVYSGDKKVNLFAHASGEYIAQVKEKINLRVSREQSEKVYLSTTEYNSLYAFGVTVPLYFGDLPEKNAEQSSETEYLILNGKRLPLGVVNGSVRTYCIKKKILSDRELDALIKAELKKRLKEDFGEYEIINKKIEIKLNGDCAEAEGYVLCLEDIGEEIPIMKNKRKQADK